MLRNQNRETRMRTQQTVREMEKTRSGKRQIFEFVYSRL